MKGKQKKLLIVVLFVVPAALLIACYYYYDAGRHKASRSLKAPNTREADNALLLQTLQQLVTTTQDDEHDMTAQSVLLLSSPPLNSSTTIPVLGGENQTSGSSDRWHDKEHQKPFARTPQQEQERRPSLSPTTLPPTATAEPSSTRRRATADTATPTRPRSSSTPSSSSTTSDGETSRPNLLFILTDQQRWDSIRFIQESLPHYRKHFKITTPNLDRLAKSGVHFASAYTAAQPCAPARACLRTGNTIARNGMISNLMHLETNWQVMDMLRNNIEKQVTYDQLLVEQAGYTAEHYGKWHLPLIYYYGHKDPNRPVITSNWQEPNVISAEPNVSTTEQGFGRYYKRVINDAMRRDGLSVKYRKGQQENPQSLFPYTPTVGLDPRFRMPTRTPLNTMPGLLGSKQLIMGIDGAPGTNWTETAVIGDMAVRALRRLARKATNWNEPFCLTVSFTRPHPHIVAVPEYLQRYRPHRSKLHVPPSLGDTMENSPYKFENERIKLLKAGLPFNESSSIQHWTAIYYSLIEEIDVWIGELLGVLDERGVRNNTLVIFTSDHGEMLGAHAMRGKNLLLEEATRVPLLLSMPGTLPENRTISTHVSHLDIYGTIMDYLQVPGDASDGTSLRRYIEKTSWNEHYDEAVIVSELNGRTPLSATQLSGSLGQRPNFMIRKDQYKLVLTKKADSPVVDMLIDLKKDPFELQNLIPPRSASDAERRVRINDRSIGKAEHLRALLLEWMLRMDHTTIEGGAGGNYYSDSVWNLKVGFGDMAEVSGRRTWPAVPFWKSDVAVRFPLRSAILRQGMYVRNEYFYIGRSIPHGFTNIVDVKLGGRDARYFTLQQMPEFPFLLTGNGHVRIQIAFSSTEPMPTRFDDTFIVIMRGDGSRDRVALRVEGQDSLDTRPSSQTPPMMMKKAMKMKMTKGMNGRGIHTTRDMKKKSNKDNKKKMRHHVGPS